MLFYRLAEASSVYLLLAAMLPGALSVRSFACSEVLDFSNQGMYCDTQSATKNYISCEFEACDGEVASISAASTGTDTLLIRVYSADGEALQHSSRADEGPPYDSFLGFEAPITGSGCRNYEARLGCYGDSTSCGGSLDISTDGLIRDTSLDVVVEASEACEYNAESGGVTVCWLHVCPGFIYSVSQESCTDMSFEASYYSMNPWEVGSCENVAPVEFLGPQVCSYARLELTCTSPSTCAATYKLESRVVETAAYWDPLISGASLKFNVVDIDTALFATCSVFRSDSLAQNDGCLGKTDFGLELMSFTPCSDGQYQLEGYDVTGSDEYSVVVFAHEDLNANSEIDDVYTILAQEPSGPVQGGERHDVNFIIDPFLPGGFVSGSWFSNYSTTSNSFIRVTGSSLEGRCFPVSLWEAEVPLGSISGTFNTSAGSYSPPGENSYYYEDDYSGYSFRLPLESECEYGEEFIVYFIDEVSGETHYSVPFTLQNPPSILPSGEPSMMPSSEPTGQPSSGPSSAPHGCPTLSPTGRPSGIPSIVPSGEPTMIPSAEPSYNPTSFPSGLPSATPSLHPIGRPSSPPSVLPTAIPSNTPSGYPSLRPSVKPSHSTTVVSCPGELILEGDTLGPYCSTNNALKNTLSCLFEVCEGEIFTVSGVDITSENILRVVRQTGEDVVANAPFYDGSLSIELPLTTIYPPLCEVFEARLGCYGYDTSCRGSLNISGQVKYVPMDSLVVVHEATVGVWEALCNFEYVGEEFPECWFNLCPYQVYNLSAVECVGDGTIDLVVAGVVYNSWTCSYLRTDAPSLGPAEACTHAHLRYSCPGNRCVFNTTIRSRPLETPVIQWLTENSSVIFPGEELGLVYQVSGVDPYSSYRRCYIFRRDSLSREQDCINTNGGYVYEKYDCGNGVHRTDDSADNPSGEYLVPSHGGTYRVVIVDLYSYSGSQIGNDYYVLSESADIVVIPDMPRDITIEIERAVSGESVIGTWFTLNPAGAGLNDRLQLVGVSSAGKPLRFFSSVSTNSGPLICCSDRCSPEILWEMWLNTGDTSGRFDSSNVSATTSEYYYSYSDDRPFLVPRLDECEYAQPFEIRYLGGIGDYPVDYLAFSEQVRVDDNSPRFQSAVFSSDGYRLNINFDGPTDRAQTVEPDYLLRFSCSSVVLILYNDSVVDATCYWENDQLLVAEFSSFVSILSPDLVEVKLLDRAVRGRCGISGSSCTTTAYSPGVSVIAESSRKDLIVAKLVVSSSIYAPCDDLYLDPTYSSGKFSGQWRSVSWSVVSEGSGASDIQAYLNSNFGRDTDLIVTIPASLTTVSVLNITMTLTAADRTGSTSISVRIAADGDQYPKVSIPGGDISILPSFPLSLFANASVSSCDVSGGVGDKTLSYQWELRNAAGTLLNFPSMSRNPRSYKLAGLTLSSKETYRVTVTVHFIATGRTSTASVLVRIGSEGVRAVVAGGVSWDVSANGAVVIDASQSRDLDKANGPLQFLLSCIELLPRYGTLCGGISSGTYTNPIQVFPARDLIPDLSPGQAYQLMFTLNVSSVNNPSYFDTATSTVSVLPADFSVPVFTFLDLRTSYDPEKEIVVGCNISTPHGFSATWSSANVDLESLKPLTPLTKSFAVGRFAFYLVLPPGVLDNSVKYTLRLSVSPLGDSKVYGSASVAIRAHNPPANGVFSVFPSSGMAYNTTFYFQTLSWSFDSDGLPASYAFQYYVTSVEKTSVMCAFDPVNSCSSILPEGASNRNSSLVVLGSARDAIGSVSQLTKEITVTSFTGDISALGALVNASFTAAFEAFDSNLIYQVLKVAADTLNVRNCSNSPNCLELNREVCRSLDNTCGPCLEGYIGIPGSSNSLCDSSGGEVAKSVGSLCASNSDCLSQTCDATSGRCISAVKLCANNCSSNGVCAYFGVDGDLLDTCLTSDLYCVATCSCFSGFSGKTCNFAQSDMEDRQKILNTLCDDYESSNILDDITADVLYRRAVMVTSILYDYEEYGYFFNKCFLSFYDAFSQTDRLENSGRLVESLLSALSSISSRAKENNLDEILSAVYNMSLLTAQYSIVDQTPGAGQKLFISDLISFSSTEVYSFDITGFVLQQPLTDSDVALGAPQDNVLITAENNPLFDITGLAAIVHYNNPSGGAVNYSMLEVESHFVIENSSSSSDTTGRRRLVSSVLPLQNYTTTVQRLHDALSVDTAITGSVQCNETSIPYTESVYCPASSLTDAQNYSLVCSGEAQELYSYACPSSEDIAVCQQWNGNEFLSDPPCSAVRVTEHNLTCHCIAPVILINKNNEILQSFVRGYTGSVSKVATSFSSTVVSVQGVNTDTILRNLVVFITMLTLLLLLMSGFIVLYYYDVAEYVKEEAQERPATSRRTISAFFEEVIPSQFDDKKWYVRLWTDLVAEHSLISIFVKSSPKDFRSVKWTLALCSVVNFMFVDTVLAILFFADDGTCEEYTNEVDCETDKSLNLQETVCEWDSGDSICSFRQPSDSFLSTLVLALVITVAVVPLDFLVSYLVHYGRLYFILVADRIKNRTRSKSKRNHTKTETGGRGALNTNSYSELRLVVDRLAILLISTRLYRLQSEINVSPLREVCFMFHDWGGWDAELLLSYASTFQNPTPMQIIRGRIAEARCYMLGLPQVLNEFGKSIASYRRDDAETLSPKEEDVLTVLYFMLERSVLSTRTRSKILLAQLEDIDNEESKQVYLMKRFIVDSVSGIRRRVACRYFFGNGGDNDSDDEPAATSWFETLCLLILVLYISFLCLFIFLFGASIGSRATNQWLLGVFVALLQAFFILEPLSILFYNILFASVAYRDIMRICKRLKSRSKYILLRTTMKMSMRHTFGQHLNPASKVACKLPELPASRLLMCLNDLDIPTRYDRVNIGTTVTAFAVAFIIIAFTSLPEVIQSNLMEIFVCSGFNFVLLGFYIFYLALGIVGPVVLGVCVFTALFVVLYMDYRKDVSSREIAVSTDKNDLMVEEGVELAPHGMLAVSGDKEMLRSSVSRSSEFVSRSSSANVQMFGSTPQRGSMFRISRGVSVFGGFQKDKSMWKSTKKMGSRSKKFVISYVVVRYAGAFMKKTPSNDSQTVQRYKKNADVVIDAIIKNEIQEQWLGNAQGWIPSTTTGGQNILLPGSTFSPVSACIVGTSFIESHGGKKWTTVLSDVEIVFELEFEFPDGGTNRIFRPYSTILDLHEKILSDPQRRRMASSVYLPYDLNFDVIADMDELFEFESLIETWANTIVCNKENSSATADFMLPTENDIELMEAELEANTTRPAFARDGTVLNVFSDNRNSLV